MGIRRTTALALCFAAAACRSNSEPGTIDVTGQVSPDAGSPDSGIAPDAGPDAGPADAGPADAGPPPPDPHRMGGLGLGPWPGGPITVYGSAQGLLEAPISASTDEAENLWVVTGRALYLLRPGEKLFRRYTAADGLHVGSGWTDPPDFTLVAGGRAGECFVGYYAHDTHDPPDKNAHTNLDPIAHMGKMDQVRLNSDLSLRVDRYDFHNSNDWHFYETRTVMSLVYDHFQHPGELYLGSNHGVTRVQPAKFRLPATSQERADPFTVEWEYYADHVHPVVCDNGFYGDLGDKCHVVFGDFFGLTLAEDGRLWMGGLTSGGAIRWTPDLQGWRESYAGRNPFVPAFESPPVFTPSSQGGNVNIRSVAVTLDGTVWFASGEADSWRGATFGLAAWDGKHFQYVDPRSIGAPDFNVLEMVAWDDKLVLGFPSTGLLVWKPGEARGKRLGIKEGLPGEAIGRMSLDRMVDPPQLLVPTEGGLAVLRSLP
jgi:hypothetical protein